MFIKKIAIVVPFYPNISESDYKYIFNDSSIKLCVVANDELFKKISNISGETPSLEHLFTMDAVEGAKNWSEIKKTGATIERLEVQKRMDAVKHEELATIIYTSGTTGNPKGVMLSHKNLLTNVEACIEPIPAEAGSKVLSFLPVCHVYERMLHYLYMYLGCSIHFAESMETIGDNIREIKPDVFTAVPRLIEKVFDKIIAKGDELSGIKRKLFFWAVNLGDQYDPVNRSAWYNFRLKIARKLIFSKWKAAFGGELHTMVSGSAALHPRLSRIFCASGMMIMEGYGLTETSPVVSVGMYADHHFKIGTVGKPISNVEVKIAEDGEILIKGPNIMKGYFKDPKKTAEVMSGDYFHTGDKGEIDADGFLKITGRKKEMFKTSGGKYIIPTLIENDLKESNFIEQVMVIGENQKMPAALIQLDFEFIKEWIERKKLDIEATPEAICASELIIDRIQKEVDKSNQGFGKWEQIKRFELTPEVWCIEGGHLTPTMKMKRSVIFELYKELAAKIYTDV